MQKHFLKKAQKRTMAFLMAAAMLLSVIPVDGVIAAETDTDPIIEEEIQELNQEAEVKTQKAAGWGAGCEGSFTDWTVTGAAYEVNEDGSLTFTMNGSTDKDTDHHPQMVNMNLEIDAAKYDKIEVVYSNDTGNTGAQFYFLETEALSKGFQPDRAFGNAISGNTDGTATFTIPVGTNGNWAGTIGAFRFNPVNTDDAKGLTGTVTIHSIRLVEKEVQPEPTPDPEPQTATAWGTGKEGSLSSWEVSDATAAYQEDGSAVLTITGPDTQIRNQNLNIKAEDYKTLILTYVNHTSCTIGEAFFITDQQTATGFQGNCQVGFTVEEGQHTVYIPFGEHQRWMGTVTGLRIDPVKDLTGGAFEIISMEFSDQKAPEKELASEWDWNTDGDFEGWSLNDKIKGGKVENSYLILPIEGEDPNISSPLMNLSAKLYPTVEISYKNETENNYAELFWNNGNGIQQSYSTTFTANNDGEWHTVRINLSKLEKWNGKITGIRIDPIRSGNGTFTIDAIRFLKTSVCDGAIAEEWEWRTDGNAEGWAAQHSSASVKDGRVVLTLDGQEDPIFAKEKEISIDASNYRTVEITYKNNTDRTDGQIYWGDKDGNWVAGDGVHVKNFTTSNDGQWHTLRVTMDDAANWTGTITKLRIDPTGDGAKGTFEIDKVAVLYDGTGDYSRYEISNGYFSISGAKGMLDKLAFDPEGKGNYSEDLVNGLVYMKLDASDVPYDAYCDEAIGTVSGNTLTISNIKFGTPEMIGTWTITLDGAKMTNKFELDTQGKSVVLKNCGFVMDILWENNTDEIEGEKDAPGSLRVPFLKTASASDRYHHVYAYKYMPSEEDVSTLGLEGEWMDWQGTNGFPFNLRFEADTEYMSALCYVDSMRYLFRQPDKEKVSLDGSKTFTRTLDITVSGSKDITPEHFAAYEASGENEIVAKGLNDIMWELGYSREPASGQTDWWEWISLTRAWRNDNYLQPDLDLVTNVSQITEETYEAGDPGIGYIYTWAGSKGWPFPTDKDSNHYLTSTANYINAVYNYYTYNGDESFLNANIEKMRLGMTYLLEQFSEKEGVFLIDHKDHNGISDLRNNVNPIQMKNNSVGSNYWDVTPYGFLSAYDNIYCYIALLRMAQIEQKLGNTDRAVELNAYASTLKENYNRLFWTGDHYIQMIDSNREEHDYGAVYLNLEALNYGLASDEQANKIMNYLNTTETSSGEADVFTRFAFAPRATMVDNQYWYVYQYGNPGEYGVKQLQNGGANMYTMYYELMSWIKTGNSDKAYERIKNMVEFFYENRHLQGNAEIEGVGNAQHFEEGIVGIWGEFPESGLVPVAVKDGFMGINADVSALNITPNMPSQMPEVSLDGIDYHGLGLKITTSNTSVTIEAQSNESSCQWMINGEVVETDQNGLFTKVISIEKGDTVVLKEVASTDGEETPEDPKGDLPETPDTDSSKNDTDKKEDKPEIFVPQQPTGTNNKTNQQSNGKVSTGDVSENTLTTMIVLMFLSAGASILVRRKNTKLL